MADPRPANRARPPALRIALVSALVGAAAALLQLGERQAPGFAPTALEAPGYEALTVDMRYRVALFAWDLARRSGVPDVAAPSEWEEAAIADYERLALRTHPDTAACHRLGLIYAGRGYLRQAREMLTRAVAQDEGAGEVYWALLLVYSEEAIRARDVPRLRASLLRQPKWLAYRSLADLARRVQLPSLAEVYDRQARREVDRFGLCIGLLALGGAAVVGLSVVSLLIAAVRALFSRGRHSAPWAPTLPPVRWIEVLEVAALAAFCNALGQAARASVGATPGSAEDLALRALHAVLALGPPLLLVIVRAERGWLPWPRALGLTSQGLGRHLFEALVGLGAVLATSVLLRDLLSAGLQTLAPGPGLGALGAQALRSAGGAGALMEFGLLVLLAPVAEELIFRGFIFRALLDELRPLAAAGLSAVLFAAAHLAWEPQSCAPLLAVGLASAYLYRHSRSLLPCILLHAAYNAAILAAGYALRM